MKTVAAFMLVLCHLAMSHAWSCKEAPRLNYATQIDAGMGYVVARDKYYRPYFLVGSSWYRLPGSNFLHVTVGQAGMWAVDTRHYIYKFVAGNWMRISGLLKQVDAGGNAYLAGVNRQSTSYCLNSQTSLLYRGIGSVPWRSVRSALRYYSCGPLGCWGVDTRYRVYVAQYVSPTSCVTSKWSYVSGLYLRMIEVGSDGRVFGLATNGKVYERTGISSGRRYGSGWRLVSLCLTITHVTYDLGRIWALSSSGVLMQCT